MLNQTGRKQGARLSPILQVGLGVVITLACLATAWYTGIIPQAPSEDATQTSATPELLEVEQIEQQVMRLVELPKGEAPSLATVTDPDKLNDQVFFREAEVGDKVLLYTEAKRAVLYRPKTGKVVEIGPFVLNPPEEENPLTNVTPPTGPLP